MKPLFFKLSSLFVPLVIACSAADLGQLLTDGKATSDVVAQATAVAEQIGGENGFGGSRMNGYAGHMAADMAFRGPADLGDVGRNMMFELVNDSDQPCTFHVAYWLGAESTDEQYAEVAVAPGETVDFELPCADIVGVGSLEEVGAEAVLLPDGTPFDNRMCVPGFLNSDYACGGTYGCTFSADVNDLDGDGDVTELVVTTTGLTNHMMSGGMRPHMWLQDGTMQGRHGFMMGGRAQ